MSKRKRHRSRSRERRRSRSRSRDRHYSSRSQRRRRHYSSSSDSDADYRHSKAHRSSSGKTRNGHKSRRYSRSHSRSRTRSRTRSRSRSRERKPSRRKVAKSQSRSRSRSRERSSRVKEKRISPVPGKAKADSKKDQSRKVEPIAKNQREDDKSTIAIPGFKNMTPAERVRAKLKLLLEKNTLEAVKKSREESKPIPAPTTAQLASIESEGFEAEGFISHRTVHKQASAASGVSSGKTSSRAVDPSEYEPQVVMLEDHSEQTRGEQDEESDEKKEEENLPLETELEDPPQSKVVMDRNQRWMQKLQRMRQKFTNPPAD